MDTSQERLENFTNMWLSLRDGMDQKRVQVLLGGLHIERLLNDYIGRIAANPTLISNSSPFGRRLEIAKAFTDLDPKDEHWVLVKKFYDLRNSMAHPKEDATFNSRYQGLGKHLDIMYSLQDDEPPSEDHSIVASSEFSDAYAEAIAPIDPVIEQSLTFIDMFFEDLVKKLR